MTRWIVICQRVFTSNGHHEVAYTSDLKEFDSRDDAISYGFTLNRSDDFNIGKLVNGRLKEFCWMQEPCEHDVKRIGWEIGLPKDPS